MRPKIPEPPIPPLLLLTPLERAILGYIVKGEKNGGGRDESSRKRLKRILYKPIRKDA
jgi:hypothetical protein